MANECSHCGAPPGPGSVVRLLGRDHLGDVIESCTKCWISRQPDKPTTLAQVAPKTSKKRR